MYRVYKAENINFGETKYLKNIDIRLLKSAGEDKSKTMANNNLKQEIEAKNIVEAAKELYANVIDEASIESIRILQNAKEEISINKVKEYDKAYKEGFEKGYKEGKNEAEAIIVQAQKVKSFLEKRKGELLKEAETDIINMVLDITKKVIKEELIENKDSIVSIIKQAIEKSAYKNEILIRVSSDDYKYIIENKALLESLVEGTSQIEVVEDKSFKKGDCIVDTPGGQINSSVDHQIKELEEAFLFILRNE